ncbi:MAG: MFS transporter [Dongiaceae bacterium]
MARTRRLHYAWIVAGLTFLTLLAAAGLRASPGVLIVPLEQEFGWSRATISAAVSLNLVLYGLMGPFSAALLDSLGVRLTISLALLLVAIGLSLTTLMTAPWQLVLLWGVVVGAGTGMAALALAATVVSRWFGRQRGLVMGVLTASTATGQLLFLPLMAWVVEHHGWRPAVLAIAAVGLLVLPPVALLMRNRPADVGLPPYGESAVLLAPPRPTVNPAIAALAGLRRGLASRDFWLLSATFFICGCSTNGLIGTHLIPSCLDHGIPEVRAAGLLAAMGLLDLVGTTASGWLSDRFDNRYLLFWYYGLRGLSLIYLPYALDLSFYGLSIFVVFYGLDWIATVPPTVRLAANAFGKEQVGVMFGWISAAHQLGAAFAATGAGVIRTATGTYLGAFVGAGGLCVLAALLALMVGTSRRGRPAEASAAAA